MREDIKRNLMGLGTVYNQPINSTLIAVWNSVLSDLTPEELSRAVTFYLKSNNPFFPKPGQILTIAKPTSNPEEMASLVADLIFKAVRSYGYDEFNLKRVEKLVGPLGMQYLQMQGGFESFASSITDNEMVPTLKAQARKSLVSLIKRETEGKQGLLGENCLSLEQLGIKMKQMLGSAPQCESLEELKKKSQG